MKARRLSGFFCYQYFMIAIIAILAHVIYLKLVTHPAEIFNLDMPFSWFMKNNLFFPFRDNKIVENKAKSIYNHLKWPNRQ
jgi:hypothetical protein